MGIGRGEAAVRNGRPIHKTHLKELFSIDSQIIVFISCLNKMDDEASVG